jgi:hypothetical protein
LDLAEAIDLGQQIGRSSELCLHYPSTCRYELRGSGNCSR